MGIIVIACYKPKEGKNESLRELMETHLPRLKAQGLVTDRASIMMEASGGTVLEVFEWVSAEAIQKAHTNPAVLQMWGEFGDVCDYVPFNTLDESAEMFPGFAPLN